MVRLRSIAAALIATALVAGVRTAVAQTTDSAAPAAIEGPHPAGADSMAFGRRVNEWFQVAQADSLWAHMTAESRQSLGSPDNVAEQIVGFIGRFGTEAALLDETLTRNGANFVYTRTVELEAAETPWVMKWTYRPGDLIVDVDLQPGS